MLCVQGTPSAGSVGSAALAAAQVTGLVEVPSVRTSWALSPSLVEAIAATAVASSTEIPHVGTFAGHIGQRH